MALTDHDTLAGLKEARASISPASLRVIGGCEFSVEVAWGEMHLLAYFLPTDAVRLLSFLADQRAKRRERGSEMVVRLNDLGIDLTDEDVLEAANGGAVGRPHVARALVARGAAENIGEAFDRFIGWGKPAFVPKDLPPVESVTALVKSVGGVTSAAHLRDRATRAGLASLQQRGVDAVEVLHPAHDEATRARIGRLAKELGLLRTGGSDWHGEAGDQESRAPLGGMDVPEEWLAGIEDLHRARRV